MVSHPALCQHSWFYWGGRYLRFLEKGNRKWVRSIRSKMIGDLCLLQTTLGCLLFSSKWRQARRGWLPSTPPEPSWSPPDCIEKWNALFSGVKHIYQVFKKQSMRQTNILAMQAGPSSAGTLIGRGAPGACFWLSFSAGSCDGTRGSCFLKGMHLIWEVLPGKEMGTVSFLNSDKVKRAGCAVSLVCLFPAWLRCRGAVAEVWLKCRPFHTLLIPSSRQSRVMLPLHDLIARRMWLWFLYSACSICEISPGVSVSYRSKTHSWDRLEPVNVSACDELVCVSSHVPYWWCLTRGNRKWINRLNMKVL